MNKAKKAIQTFAMAFAMTFTLIAPARAQIPVTDLASIMGEITHHAETLVQWKAQFDEWKRQYEALNGVWADVREGVLSWDEVMRFRGTFPAELEEYMTYGDMLIGTLRGDYDRLRSAVSTLAPDQFPAASVLANQLDSTLNAIAGQQAAADNIYRSSQSTLATNEQLFGQLRHAETVKQVSDLNARVNLEILGALAESNRIAAIRMRQEADERRIAQQQKEDWLRGVLSRTPAVNYTD